ncbi:MAG: mannose-1-phosphate guanylyltransferase/mannose-6-phosphate isomerase [Bacillota bacterium]|nr:mannose-1-phosphate guanylyltransferase/mannose-6-phosphate isomerase [Bacillota bacterium]
MYAVILAGGSGTRLWPLSRTQFPKQFIDFTDNGRSLFQETIARVKSIIPENRIIIVANSEQENNIKHQLDQMGLKEVVLLKETRACNTAPAIGLAAWYLAGIAAKDKDAIMAVLPSDHVIAPGQDFAKLINRGCQAADAYGIVTFGIKPDYPETGYGYILSGQQLDGQAFKVEKFMEKPELALAEKYIRDKRYLWNSGMFVFKVRELMAQYRRYLPSLADGLDKIDYKDFSNLEHVYNSFDSVSIDYGLLEKTTDTTVIPAGITWSDVGSWDAVYKISPKDANGNYHKGRIISIGSRNTLAFSSKPLVGLIGVENIAVIATEDALLVCAREKSQEVKNLVDRLESDGASEYMVHPTVHRPWGSFTVLVDQDTYKVKKIVVNPGSRLSLQSHRHRSEHWLVARGQALATVNDEEKLFEEGKHIFIPQSARHRLENPGKELLEVIEVQKGDYLGEDDITRYQDDYGRSGTKTPEQIFKQWMNSEIIDATNKRELREIENSPTAIQERFGSELVFGTGGLRGIIGAGLNRMNIYVVRKATQGLADYINKQYPVNSGQQVAIAYDTRHYSREFAQAAAQVLAANGIKALIFADARPTPLLSFAIRELGCAAGIVITASHNPSEYNGYKVYQPDGGQAVSPFIDKLTEAITDVDIFRDVRNISVQKAKAQGLLEIISPRLDNLYLEQVASLSLSRPKQKLKVVFTPLHGTGSCFIPKLLKQTGYIDLFVVETQMVADPGFPTVKTPNPEDRKSFAAALDLARQEKADLVMATDPDCDRLGCAVKNEKGDYDLLTGSQIGALLLEYLLGRLKEKDELPAGGVIIKTIVTDDLGKKIAASYGVHTIETLTGFKYIGEKIKELEAAGSPDFLFGYEESYGYLAGTFVRDKDANIAGLLIAEMAAYYQECGQSLLQVLENLHQRFGYFKEELVSLELKDEAAADRLIAALDRQPPQIEGVQIVEKRDYHRSKSWDILNNRTHKLTLPRSKVLYYRFSDGSWFCIRPSGTEPKIKIYFSAVGANNEEAENKLTKLKDTVLAAAKE